MKKKPAIIAILLSVLLPCMTVHAGTVWDGAGANTNINTANNWNDNVNPPFDGTQTVTFGTGGTTARINTNVSFLGLIFNSDSNFTVAASAGTLTIGAGGINAAIPGITSRTYTISEGIFLAADQTWTATNNGAGVTTLTVSGAVSGAGRNLTLGGTGNTNISGVIGTGPGSLSMTGTGTLTLSGANTYSGGTALSSGALRVGNNAALGTGTLTLSGGTLASSSTTARILANDSVVGGNFILGQASGGTGALTLSGAMDLGGAMRQITVNNAADTISGVISGTGGITKSGTGALTLSGANTYTGGTTLSSGTLLLGDDAALGTGSLALDGGTLASSSTTARTLANNIVVGGNVILGRASGGTGALTLSGAMDLGGAMRQITVNNAADTISGVISGTGGITKAGTGALTLSGANTYSGGTTVNAGKIVVDSDGNLGDASGQLTFGGGGTLQITNGFTSARNVTLNGGGGAFDTNGNDLTMLGNMTGTGALTKTGDGALTLSGTNTYTGATTINGGILRAGVNNALSTTTAVTLANTAGAGLDLNNFDQTIGSLAGGGTTGGNITLGSGTLTAGNASSTTYAGIISGTGGFVKKGTGTLTLTGANTYSGGTTVSAGNLQGDSTSIQGNITNNARVIFNQAAEGVYSDDMTGTGGITKAGVGTLTLSGANTYTGTTIISAGILRSGVTNALGTATAVTLANTAGAGLDLNNFDQTIGSLAGGGTTGGNITLGSGRLTAGNSSSTTYAGAISGTGGLVKTGTGTLTLTGANTYTGGTTVSTGGITGNSTSLQGSITNNALVTFNQTAAGTYSGDMTGTGALTKTGAGALTLSGTNTYAGNTTISAGILRAGANNALSTTTAVTLANTAGAGLDLNNFDQTIGSLAGGGTTGGNVTLGSGTLTAGNASSTTYAGAISGTGSLVKTGTGTLTLTGANTYTGGTTVSAGGITGNSTSLQGSITNNTLVTFNQTAAGTYAGDMTGTGALTKTGAGALTLSGTNTYTGNTTISTGILRAGVNNALSTTTAVTLANTVGASLDLNNYDLTIGSLAGGGTTTRGSVTLGSGTLTTGNDSNTSYAGVISGTGSLVKTGTGTFILSGTSTYSGGTTLASGTLLLGNNAALGTGTLTLDTGTLASSSTTARTLANSTVINGDITLGQASGGTGALTLSGAMDLGGAVRQITVNNAADTISGAISGAGGITKAGTGTLTLTGANTYSGGTTVSAGGITGNSTSLQGSITNNALVTFNQTAAGTYAGDMTGTGAFTKTGTGALTLSGTNTYTGATTISAGILRAGVNNALSTTTAVTLANTAGAALDLNNFNLTIGSVAGGGTTGGSVTLGTGTLTTGNDSSTAYAGVISGTGSLVKTGTGTLTLSGASTYSGGTTLATGTLLVGNNAALGTGTLTLADGTLASSSTTARTVSNSTVINGDITLGRASGGTGALTLSGPMDLGGAVRQITVNNAADTISGAISGAGGITKAGTGTLTLTGANTYTGGTTVSAGGITGNSTSLQGSITNNALVTFNQTAAGTYAGDMTGSGALTKTGAGALTLSGTNTYTGATTISAGILRAGVNNALSTTTAVTLANTVGASLDLNNFDLTIGSLAGGGTTTRGSVTLGSGTLTTGNDSTTTYAGVISGTGSLVKTGTGTFTLSGASTYSGGTVINEGTISVGSNGNLGNVLGQLTFGGGTLRITNGFASTRDVTLNAGGGTFDTSGNNLTMSGDMTGTGGITKAGAGTLTLTGGNTYTGKTTINGGILGAGVANALGTSTAVTLANTAGAGLDLNNFDQTIGSLAGGGTTGGNVTLGTGTLTTGDASSTIYAGTISGTGSLVKIGTGTFTLSGANTYTGTTTIDAGSLSVTGSLASPVIISVAGTLKGNSTINANVINKGTIAPGNSIGTISIAGNYTQNAGSVYQVEVNEEGQSDKLNVGGTATLNGGTVAVMAESGIFRLRTPYTILTAVSVAGTFADVTSNLAFLTPSLSYDATHVYLLLARNSTDFSAVAYTGNQKAVASALDRIALSARGDMEDIINTLLYLSSSGARGAYDQMGGLTHSALTGVTFSSFNTYIGAIAERTKSFMVGGSSSPFAGRSGMLALGGDAASDTAGALITALGRAQGERSPSSGLWAQGYGSTGDRRADDISSRYGYDTSGMMAGLDRQVADSLLLGISLGYSSTRAHMKELPDKATISSYQGALYGIYRNDPWYVSSVAAYGYNRYDTTRGISFGQIARRANVAYGGHTLGGYAEAGYRIAAAPVDVIPMVSLTGASLMRNGFQERDAGAMNLDVDAGRTSSLVGSLGVRLRKDYTVSSGSVTPEVRMRWDHEFSKNDHVLEASFCGYPTSAFTVRADRPERNSFAPGFTLTWRTKDNMDFHLTYDGSFSEDSTRHWGTLGLRYTW